MKYQPQTIILGLILCLIAAWSVETRASVYNVEINIDGSEGYFDKKDGFRDQLAGGGPTILNKDSDPGLQAMANFSYDDTHLGGGVYNLTSGYFWLDTKTSGDMNAAKNYQGVLNIGAGQMTVSGKKVVVDIDRDSTGTSAFNGDNVYDSNKNINDTVLVDGVRDQFRVEIEFTSNVDAANIGDLFTLQNTNQLKKIKMLVSWRNEKGDNSEGQEFKKTRASGHARLEIGQASPSTVPEATSIVGFGLLVGLGCIRRRRR
jgi:hypothetical protein